MGSLIGVLSTVILVSTVCTLIFAVGAYVISRKGRNGVGTLDQTTIPGIDATAPFPPTAGAEGSPSLLFKRAKTGSHPVPEEASTMDEEYQWK